LEEPMASGIRGRPEGGGKDHKANAHNIKMKGVPNVHVS